MAVLRLSFTNLDEAAAASVTGSGQACTFCSSEAQQPQRPFRPWRTLTTTTPQDWLLDLGSSQTLDVIALINAGFTSATIQGASSSGLFGAPGYTQAITLTRDPLTWRYQLAHLPVAFGYRWLRVKLDGSTSTVATGPSLGSTYFSLGGVWAGVLTSAPSHLMWGAHMKAILPKLDVGPAHGGWVQRLRMGEPRAQISGTISANITPATPLLGDDADLWSDILRQWIAADYAYLYTNLGDPAQGRVMRCTDDIDYQVDGTRVLVHVLLDEVVGP